MREQLSVRIPKELGHYLRVQADREGRSEAEIIREVLELYLKVIAQRQWAVLNPDMIELVEETAGRESKKPEQVLREAIWARREAEERWKHLDAIIYEIMETKGYAMMTAINQIGREAFNENQPVVRKGAEMKKDEVIKKLKR